MASLLAFLQSELTTISQETRRKCPDVKTLKTLKDVSTGNLPQMLAEQVNVARVLELASTCSQSTRIMSNIIALLHRLVAHAALPASALPVVLTVLDCTVEQTENVQLRALQCVMPLLTHYTCQGEDLFKTYEICFKLQACRSPTVINAAVAIIRQLVIWLFERVVEEDGEPVLEEQVTLVTIAVYNGEKASLRPISADAYIIMQDICLLTVDEAPLKFPLKTLNKSFGLELIESVLLYNSRVMRRHQVFSSLIREKICPMVLKKLTERSDFSQTCRLWKVVSALIREFYDIFATETEIFISCAVRLIEESDVPWERALVLETFREILANPSLVSHMEIACRQGQIESKLLPDLFISLNNLILGTCVRLHGIEMIYSQVSLKVSISQQLEKIHPPTVNDSYLVLVASECISGFLHCFLEEIRPQCMNGKKYIILEGTSEIIMMGRRLLDVLWAAILKSQSMMLSTCKLDGEWQGKIIAALMDLVRLESVLGFKEAQGATLEELLEIALPEYRISTSQGSSKTVSAAPSPNMSNGSLFVSDVNLSMSVMLLNVGLEIGELLEDAWLYILHVVHGTDQFNVIKVKRASELGNIGMDRMGEIADLCRRIMESSRILSNKAFICFLKSLCQLGCQITGNVTALFPAQKLKQVALLNVERFIKNDTVAAASWELLISQLEQILNSLDVTLCGLGCETVSLLTTQFSTTVPIERFNSALQQRLLGALERFYGSATRAEVHKTVLESLLKLLQHLGPHITDGWPIVFRVLSKATEPNDASLPIVRSAFSSAKLICAEFLPMLPRDSISETVSVLSHFARISEDLNISLTAIGLLWDVADHVRRSGDDEDLWLLILKQLVGLSRDLRPEVRNSAIQTMIRAIEIGGVPLKTEEWKRILLDNLDPLLAMPNEPIAKSTPTLPTTNKDLDLTHHSRDTGEKQWNETFLLIIQGTTQLYCKFLPVMSQSEEFERQHWSKLLELFSSFSGKSSELTTASIACLARLVGEGTVSSSNLWRVAWNCWCEIGGTMQATSKCYTQDSLLKFVRILSPIMGLLHTQDDLDWLNASFNALDNALQCPTPEDHVRDVDAPTELQRTVLEIADTLLDYDGAHQQARPLYLRKLAGWIGWLHELTDVEMTTTTSVRRSRIGTGSSLRQGMSGKVSYIGLVTVVLERLRIRTADWPNDVTLHIEGAYGVVIQSLGRLMTLKYRAPTGPGPVALWKLATKTLNAVLLAILPTSASENEWPVVVTLMENVLDVSKTQVPTALALDQLDADEDFDVTQVLFVRDSLLPLMGNVSTSLIQRLLVALERTSRLYTNLSDDPHPSSPSTLAVSIQPVIKEKLAITCLHALFSICTDRSTTGQALPAHSRASFSIPTSLVALPSAILHAALPILLKRCQEVMQRYTRDKTLLGRMPFPRVRQDEMIYVLSALNELLLPPGLATDSTGTRRMLLDTRRGHLFYLYAELCECLRLEDPPVVSLVQQSFCLLGLELNLINS